MSRLPGFGMNVFDSDEENATKSEAKTRRDAFLELIEFRPFLSSLMNLQTGNASRCLQGKSGQPSGRIRRQNPLDVHHGVEGGKR